MNWLERARREIPKSARRHTSPSHLRESEFVWEAYEERAAIMEFDGGLSRDEADREAWALVRPSRLRQLPLKTWYTPTVPKRAQNGTAQTFDAILFLVKSSKRRRAPGTENGTVPPRLIAYATRRPREYLTVKEVGLLMGKARHRGRYGHRDATMIPIAYRHGLRAGELCALRCDQVDLERGPIHVRRLKNGTPSVHPMGGTEMRALRRLVREQTESRYVFLTERRAPMTTAGFRKMVGRIGEAAKFPFPVHPHMLRHACGYKLANDGQDTRAVQHYLGHKNTRLSA